MGARGGEQDEDVDSDEGNTKNPTETGAIMEDERIVENLLGIRGSCVYPYAQQDGQSENLNLQSHHSVHLIGVSITKLFEPKFLEIYHAYKDHICNGLGSPDIDLSQHLMSLCLDHLVTFSCWARESTSRCIWIQKTLDDNVDLRPEVRNGLCMVFVYAFSAAKALETKDTDMFLVLQEPETGLGIVNKTSLKIYNDPFCYFSFLKACMSGLIDAGKLPENERLNQPKKPRRQVELGEELGAFIQMRAGLVLLFNRGDIEIVREKVRQILAVWQYRAKSIRNRRFATALSVMSNQKASPFLVADLLTMGPPLGNINGFISLGHNESAMQNHNYSRKGDSRPTSDSVVRHSDFGNSNDKRNLQAYSDSKKVTNQYSNKSTSSNKNGHGEKKGVTDSSALHSLMNLSSAASNLRPYDGMQQHSSRPKLNLHNPINGNMLPVSSSISSIYNSSKDLSTTHQPSSKQGCGSGSGSCGGSGTRGSNSGSGSDLVFDGSKSSRGCGGNNSKDSKDYNSKVNNNFNQSAYVNDDTYDISNIRENVIDDNDSNPMDTNKNVISNGGCHGKKSLKRSHADLDDVASSEMRSRHSSYQTGNKSPQIGKEHKSNRPGKEDEKVKEVFRSCRCPGPDRDDIEIDLGFERDASNEVQAKSGGCGSNRNSNVLSKCGQVENDIDKNRSVDTDRTDDQYYRHDMRNNISPADMEENPTFYPGDDQRSASGSASRSASRSRSRSNSDSDQSSRSRSVPHDTDIVNLCSSPTYSGHDSDIALNRIGNRLQNGNNNNGNGSNTMLIDQSQLLTTHDSNMPLTSCTAATSDSSLIHASVPLRGIKSIRFERMSATEWEMKENRIFNIDSLLAETGFVVHLVNESKFSPEEMRDMLLVGRSAGFVNLQSELQQRKALIASWPKAEHSNFANFINEWRKDQNADLALMNFWNSSASRKNEITKRQQGSGQEMPLVDGINSGVLSNGDVKCDMLDIVTQGTGVIVYEMVMKIGFIIRANKSLNIPDDCWRVIYSRELHSTSLQAPFSTFLGDLFPQLRSVLAKFDNLEECVVKYCPHSASNEKLTKPPSMLESSYYQTIGTMTETSADMIGRLEANQTIHDFILQF